MRHLWLILTLTATASAPLPALAQGQASEVKRDPSGQKGISPYNEALAKGRDSFKSKDYAGAVTHFDAAISDNGDKMLAYLLKAQAQLANNDLDAALKTTEEGRAKRGTEEQQAKMLFLLADLRERKADTPPGADGGDAGLQDALKGKWEAVREVWNGYMAYLTDHTRVPDYSASAKDRIKKVDERVKRDRDYGQVKARIAKNAKERASK